MSLAPHMGIAAEDFEQAEDGEVVVEVVELVDDGGSWCLG